MGRPKSGPAEEALDRHDASKPADHVTLPSGVDVYCFDRSTERDDVVLVEYHGWASDLIASAMMTEEWLQPSGKHLKDHDGDRVSLQRFWRVRDGQPARYCIVHRYKPKLAALSLPGAVAAAAAIAALYAWGARRNELVDSWDHECRQGPQRPRPKGMSPPALRLVVDNTRQKVPAAKVPHV